MASSGYAPKIDVYIIYGDNVTYGDDQKTNYDGSYEFRYLRKGGYKIYAYTRVSAGTYQGAPNQLAPDIAVVQSVSIGSSGETVTVPDIKIIK